MFDANQKKKNKKHGTAREHEQQQLQQQQQQTTIKTVNIITISLISPKTNNGAGSEVANSGDELDQVSTRLHSYKTVPSSGNLIYFRYTPEFCLADAALGRACVLMRLAHVFMAFVTRNVIPFQLK